jgi:hypothetical protein
VNRIESASIPNIDPKIPSIYPLDFLTTEVIPKITDPILEIKAQIMKASNNEPAEPPITPPIRTKLKSRK